MKVGLHTGPVVAGIIGKTKYSYDIWGDAVNIASRMESQGEPGKVQVSEATFQQIDVTHDCRMRGVQEIKGKGSMATWFVDRRRKVPTALGA